MSRRTNGRFSRIPTKPSSTKQTFDLVQKIRGNVRRYPDGWGEAAPLTGLLYCADCGGKMYVHRTNNGKRISQYTCSQYSKSPSVERSARHSTVSMKMWYCPLSPKCSKPLPSMQSMSEPSLSEWCRKRSPVSRQAEVKKQRTRLATAKQRVSELEVLLCKIYEDNVLGKLSDSQICRSGRSIRKGTGRSLPLKSATLEKAVRRL